MHQTLATIQQQLEKIIAQVMSAIPSDEPFGNAHGNWSCPGLTRAELSEEAQSIVDAIQDRGIDDVGEHEARLNDYVRRLQHLQQQTVAQLWSNSSQAVPAYMFTLEGLRKALAPVLNRDGHAEAVVNLRKLTGQLRAMESRLRGLEPRTASLATMVDRIEQACNAADRLPTDLESLSEARQEIAGLVQEATKDQARLLHIREEADGFDAQLIKSAEEAEAVLERCETAYSAATSVGLAAAFNERSDALSKSMWIWVGGLVAALVAGNYFGSGQLRTLSELFRIPNPSTSVIVPYAQIPTMRMLDE